MKSIESIPRNGLCTGCGSCAGICPNSAIEIVIDSKGIYVPKRDESLCNDCDLCIKVCPGHQVDFEDLNSYVFSKLPEHPEIGNFKNTYLGHSSDEVLRKAGQSGGLVSALLIYALKNRIIDGAIVTRMNPNDPLTPQTFIAKSEEEILEASKSKYCPVPTNRIFKDLKEEEGKFVFVGIPCQMHGLRKAERIMGGIKRKIVLHFGLFCDRTLNFHFQDYILSLINAGRKEVDEFVYRSKEWQGWPGDLLIRLKDGRVINLHKRYRLNAKQFFTPWRCYLCFDKLNELSDISFGDAWLPKFSGSKEGTSMIISRTDFADDFLKKAKHEGVIELKPIKWRDIVKAQKPQEKKFLLRDYFQVSRSFGKGRPEYGISFGEKESKKFQILSTYAFFDFFIYQLSDKPSARKIVNFTPPCLLNVISRIRNKALSHRKQVDVIYSE